MYYTHKKTLSRILTGFIIITSLLTSGCIPTPRIYKLDIEQGNKLTTEAVNSIKIGMTKDEVHSILGTPILNAIFRKDNWYYIYYRQPGYGKLEKRYLIVYFIDGMVSQISQDYTCK